MASNWPPSGRSESKEKHPAMRADNELTQLMEKHRAEAALRHESLGPIVEAVGHLRACFEAIRLLLDETEAMVVVHLELLDHVLVNREGSRWWEQLTPDDQEGGS
jgi:hypothetical protein